MPDVNGIRYESGAYSELPSPSSAPGRVPNLARGDSHGTPSGLPIGLSGVPHYDLASRSDQKTQTIIDHHRFNVGESLYSERASKMFEITGIRPAYTWHPDTLFGTAAILELFFKILYDEILVEFATSGPLNRTNACNLVKFMVKYQCYSCITIALDNLCRVALPANPTHSFSTALIAACIAESLEHIAWLLDNAVKDADTWEFANIADLDTSVSQFDVRGFSTDLLKMIPVNILCAILRTNNPSNSEITGWSPGKVFLYIIRTSSKRYS
ncbi:hypothetical protein CC85DRAFT_302139 [Cutaneotrichosporon oleaginosum]|uniref:Uncharacterized protein n=1 Tax=Cutaneotrichosporon oleaginosum TaxID=879819 RepID=A0A0J0XNG3_9TREE|nr:uncharacterized protein CC85DRAFT_302139 [Cutaneotrichosporon oleaginosum]KLT42617.1 hypothetical protein CC85DRAFT_302139 [Cutaneotrichosporon oleaginosum]TXT05266.1 hypothetical protein COLE_06586 [Cutaneotrichosporon oleaginosum]